MSTKIRMNRTWEEFQKQPKVKQIFTPWFVAALLVFIVCGSIAFAMAGLLNEGFQIARWEVTNEVKTLQQAIEVDGVQVNKFVELGDRIYDHRDPNSLSLMAWLGYDPHASYQTLYKSIKDVLDANPNVTIDDLLHKKQADLLLYTNNDEFMAKNLYEALHFHAHSNVVNHNGTWGFVVKVLSDGTNSWFYKFTELFAHASKSATHATEGLHSVSPAYKLQTILYYNNPAYNAYYWVFIIFMMPQMISTIIIVVKLATVLNPKKSKEEKAAYKLEKQKAKLLKNNKPNKLDNQALGAH